MSQGEMSSSLQSNIVRAIRAQCAHVQEEYRCETTGYSIDAVATLKNGDRIAVEVDGPSHYLGGSQQPTGATQLKRRQLRHFGLRLVSTPYWEWGRSSNGAVASLAKHFQETSHAT